MVTLSTDNLPTEETWIEKKPSVCGGDACIRDTRIPVWSLLAAYRRGVTKSELLHHFVTPLTATDVRAAFAYCEQHSDEIELEIRLNEQS